MIEVVLTGKHMRMALDFQELDADSKIRLIVGGVELEPDLLVRSVEVGSRKVRLATRVPKRCTHGVPDDGDGIFPCARCGSADSTDVAGVVRLPKLG